MKIDQSGLETNKVGKFPGLTQTNFADKKDRKMTDFDLPIEDF